MIKSYKGRKTLREAGVDREYARLRYRTFVQEQGWPLPHRNGEEWDIYDTEDAVYILSYDSKRKIEGGVRMLKWTPDLRPVG